VPRNPPARLRFAARSRALPRDSRSRRSAVKRRAHYADIRADLERKGHVIGPYDLMIAGHARSRGLVVITGNLDEYNRVAGLRAEDWLAQ